MPRCGARRQYGAVWVFVGTHCWKEPREARMEPPIQTLNLRSVVAIGEMIFTLSPCSPRIRVVRLCSVSEKHVISGPDPLRG
jgi:hypothetical protein